MAHEDRRRNLSRRGFFDRISDGIYGTALATVLGNEAYGSVMPLLASSDLKPRTPHFAPKAKSVIHLFMNGGPSQVDLFDPKPLLQRRHGETHSLPGPNNLTHSGTLMGSPFAFRQHGKSGAWISELMPCLAQHVDDIAIVRSMHTTHFNHEQALFMAHTGGPMAGRPALGSWAVFGLGTENQNLPAYAVLDDPRGLPVNGASNWQNGFLPPLCQGTRLRSDRVGQTVAAASAERDLIATLDRVYHRDRSRQSELDARIAGYELTAQLQLTAGDTLDISNEPAATREMYGIGQGITDSYGRRCLMARRLVERGVRFVQIYMSGQIWDHHSFLENGMRDASLRTDKPVAGLLQDLKQRGLLKDTLVIWGGEFGRLPLAQVDEREQGAGRDHNPNGFSLWMAGGGIRPGVVYGETDEIGYQAVDSRVSVADWHATILHLLGLDYQKLVFDQSGVKEKRTSANQARVVRQLLA